MSGSSDAETEFQRTALRWIGMVIVACVAVSVVLGLFDGGPGKLLIAIAPLAHAVAWPLAVLTVVLLLLPQLRAWIGGQRPATSENSERVPASQSASLVAAMAIGRQIERARSVVSSVGDLPDVGAAEADLQHDKRVLEDVASALVERSESLGLGETASVEALVAALRAVDLQSEESRATCARTLDEQGREIERLLGEAERAP